MHGIYKELQKHFGSSVQNYLVAARTAQGYEQLAAATQQQRLDVVKRWQATQLALQEEKQHVKKHSSPPADCVFLRLKNATHTSLEERRKHIKNGKLHKTPGHPKSLSSSRKKNSPTAEIPRLSASADTLAHADTATFDEAIQQAVQATSRGNPQQDETIERAIRASVMELREASKSGNEDQAIQKAIKASVAEASRARNAMSTDAETAATDHDEDLRLALQRSVSTHAVEYGLDEHGFDDSGVDTDEDENIKAALEQSSSVRRRSSQDDTTVARPMEESRLAHDQHTKDLVRERTEEEIVLEYVKKQSMLEDEHRGALVSGADAG